MRNIIFVSLVVLILILIPGGLFWYKNNIVTVATEEAFLCKDFPKTENEVACKDALNIAKTRNSTKVRRIVKANKWRQTLESPTSDGIDTWVIVVKNIAIVIDRKTGEIIKEIVY